MQGQFYGAFPGELIVVLAHLLDDHLQRRGFHGIFNFDFGVGSHGGEGHKILCFASNLGDGRASVRSSVQGRSSTGLQVIDRRSSWAEYESKWKVQMSPDCFEERAFTKTAALFSRMMETSGKAPMLTVCVKSSVLWIGRVRDMVGKESGGGFDAHEEKKITPVPRPTTITGRPTPYPAFLPKTTSPRVFSNAPQTLVHVPYH